jgi:hypothetical protein
LLSIGLQYFSCFLCMSLPGFLELKLPVQVYNSSLSETLGHLQQLDCQVARCL